MDCFKDPSLKLKYQKSKLKVKLWESEFRKEKGVNPSKVRIITYLCSRRALSSWDLTSLFRNSAFLFVCFCSINLLSN